MQNEEAATAFADCFFIRRRATAKGWSFKPFALIANYPPVVTFRSSMTDRNDLLRIETITVLGGINKRFL